MSRIDIGKTSVVSVSMLLSAVSSVSAAPQDIEIDKEYSLDQEIMNQINKISESKSIKDSVANVFDTLVEKMKEGDKNLIEKYFSDYLDEDGVMVAQTFDSDNLRNCRISNSACYTNCYSNCHGACHGSRGWR